MAILHQELRQSWKLIDQLPPTSGWRAVRLGFQTNGRHLLLARDEAGLRHLLVPALQKRYSVTPTGVLTLEIGHREFTFFDRSSEYGRYLDITCHNPHLNEQFDHVVATVVEFIDTSQDGADAAIIQVVRWRSLFSRLTTGPALTTRDKIGLFAELTVLEAITSTGLNNPLVWTGPLRAPHDFELPTLSIEVKGIMRDTEVIQIHGVEQMSTLDGKPLDLVIVELEESEKGMTISELLDRIATRVGDEGALRQRAAIAGIASKVDDDRFEVVRSFEAEIDEAFPRIHRKDLDSAIGNVKYELKLSEILPLMGEFTLRGMARDSRG